MFGEETIFHCPCCGLTGIFNMGVTPFVTIKGNDDERLAVDTCPVCEKKIAFKMMSPNKMFHANLNYEMVDKIQELIKQINTQDALDKDIVKDFILSGLKKMYEQKIIDDNYNDIIIVLETAMSLRNGLFVKAICLDDVDENDIKQSYTVCF